ncbi:hypothetical protein [Williamsia sp. CHRR-6]|uniref:hypothetical protein n=1 Tax=Williamsia sp. CHRR-6 TaxID=2835871 RepID=UPI001BD9A4B5|nr:hypothetical protein [Williamsia sp. CHRR-6]MBT0566158.1 hypothetical protein [Williamsia sp. CHRR-6]
MGRHLMTRTRPELTVAIDGEDHPIAWSGPRPTSAGPARVVRIRRGRLADGIAERARLRAEFDGDPADLVVALEVEAVIAERAADARSEYAAARLRAGDPPATTRPTVQYVGTPAGLLSLIDDLYVAEVADAVIITPVNGLATAALVADQVLPRLRARHSRTHAA